MIWSKEQLESFPDAKINDICATLCGWDGKRELIDTPRWQGLVWAYNSKDGYSSVIPDVCQNPVRNLHLLGEDTEGETLREKAINFILKNQQPE